MRTQAVKDRQFCWRFWDFVTVRRERIFIADVVGIVLTVNAIVLELKCEERRHAAMV